MTQKYRGCIYLLLIITACIFLFPSCANIVPPSGGPKDTTAPELVGVSPDDSTLHFKSKKVVFTFDEYVELDNIFDKLIVSPTLKRTPLVTSKLRTVTMVIKDTLEQNTTYTFNFSDAIRDINERNPVKEFQYVVSTGDYLDSLQVRGFVINAETGRPDSNVSVMMYRHTMDSVVSKEKPVYFARSKGNGSFWFKNMAPGDYKLFALKEEDKDLEYDQPSELIAFKDSLIHLTENQSNIVLLNFLEKDSTIKTPEELAEAAAAAPPPVEETNHQRKEKEKELEKERKRHLTVATNFTDNKQELGQPMTLTFSGPVKTFDSTKISLDEDTIHKAVSFTTKFDSTRKVLSVYYDWKEGKPYRMIIPKEAVQDTLGQNMAKTDTLMFDSKKESDYGKVLFKVTLGDSIRAEGGDTMHYVIQMVQGKDIKYTGKVVNGSWTKTRITPGEYEFRVLLDANNNGKWDRGVYYGTPKKQPERVVSFPKKENIKAHWGITVPLAL
jgi:hypothetical protein